MYRLVENVTLHLPVDTGSHVEPEAHHSFWLGRPTSELLESAFLHAHFTVLGFGCAQPFFAFTLVQDIGIRVFLISFTVSTFLTEPSELQSSV